MRRNRHTWLTDEFIDLIAPAVIITIVILMAWGIKSLADLL